MKDALLRFLLIIALATTLSCASVRSGGEKKAPESLLQADLIMGSPFGPVREFVGSPYPEVGFSGLFAVHPDSTCRIAVLSNGDDSLNSEPAVQSCSGKSIQIWEWQGRRTHAIEQTEGTIHAKYAVFDRRLSIVGSYNMDPRSRNLNSETVIVFESKILSRQLADKFYENDLDFSRRITLEDTKSFIDSTDAIYQLQKEFGILLEEGL